MTFFKKSDVPPSVPIFNGQTGKRDSTRERGKMLSFEKRIIGGIPRYFLPVVKIRLGSFDGEVDICQTGRRFPHVKYVKQEKSRIHGLIRRSI